MDTNGIFSNSSCGSGMLGLEMSLSHHHNQQQQQNPQQNPNFFHHQPPFAGAGAGKQPYPYAPKQRASPISDEEELHSNNMNNPSTTEDSGGGGGAGAGDGKMRKGSPWQRMKWTDNMVRLLIMVVFYIGDEVSSDQPAAPAGSDTPAAAAAAKRKVGAGGGVLQKKGKWKSVSKAMMERGFYVSPQQCEDKFNDLNKRYKRVNDILGKGTACKVVENQSLLESMDHLPAKMKEEAKKLLNSKHLFFREMCAYHNSGAGAGSSAAHHSSPPEVTTTEQTPAYINHRQNCVHSNDNEEEEEEDDGGDDEDDDGDGNGDGGRYHLDDEEDEGLSSRKRARIGDNDGYEGINVIQQFRGEISCVIQDLTKSIWEKRQWMKGRMMQLEEQRVGFQGQSYELEKQRLKWIKFSCKKEREMEVEKLRNERMKLENERMVLLLRQKDMELGDLQQQYSSSNAHK